MLEKLQTLWNEGGTGRSVFNIIPKVNQHQMNWVKEDSICFSDHGPFPAYLKRYLSARNDFCTCGGIGKTLHYATKCILIISWHLRKPAPNELRPTTSPGIKSTK
ncbi:hypothetical protein AVEN_34226-1 [Araneus ventricosus]|uniref:Uncharacterized protein n=1 Tax=Araneus ventricosus TaxID=182803 RepID=A0A4Y2QA23_ARAVE|nr:hypothetical protein AVEN_34226-1 [Araneus ventricosus]